MSNKRYLTATILTALALAGIFFLVPNTSSAASPAVCTGTNAVIDGTYLKSTDRLQVEMGSGVHYFSRESQYDSKVGGRKVYLYDTTDSQGGFDTVNVFLVKDSQPDEARLVGFLAVWLIDNDNADNITVSCVTQELSLTVTDTDPSPTTNGNINSDNENATTSAGVTNNSTDVSFRLFPKANTCREEEALTCWIGEVFKWSQTGIMLLSTVAFVVAGIIYMTSAGNTKQIELAKKIMFGALSAVATIVLGKFFLTVVVGVPWVN